METLSPLGHIEKAPELQMQGPLIFLSNGGTSGYNARRSRRLIKKPMTFSVGPYPYQVMRVVQLSSRGQSEKAPEVHMPVLLIFLHPM